MCCTTGERFTRRFPKALSTAKKADRMYFHTRRVVSDSRLEKFEAVHCSETLAELKEFLTDIKFVIFMQGGKKKRKSCFKVFYMQKASDLWMGKFTCCGVRESSGGSLSSFITSLR